MCACFTFFSYLHTKNEMSLQYNHWKSLKKGRVSSIKHNCNCSVINPTDLPLPNRPHPPHPNKTKNYSRSSINKCVLFIVHVKRLIFSTSPPLSIKVHVRRQESEPPCRMCQRCIEFTSFYHYSIGFWKCHKKLMNIKVLFIKSFLFDNPLESSWPFLLSELILYTWQLLCREDLIY